MEHVGNGTLRKHLEVYFAGRFERINHAFKFRPDFSSFSIAGKNEGNPARAAVHDQWC